MPTTNPRLSITLTPEVAAVLRRVSSLAEKSQSAFVAELLEQSVPIFERMAKLLEAAHQARDHLSRDMASSLDRAQTKIERQLGLSLEAMDEGFRPIVEEAERVQRRRRTPMSNRGVTTSAEGPARARKAAR